MITASLLRSWGACWSDDEIATRLNGRTSVTPRAGDEDDQAQYLGLLNEMRQIELEIPADRRGAAWDAARGAAWGAAWGAELRKAIGRALEYLGDEADS